MHDTKVTLKDGRVLIGPIWMWRPTEGWFSLTSDDPGADHIALADVASAITRGTRDTVGQDRDELVRARKDGWKG